MTDQELKDLVASLAIDSKNLHAAQMETRKQIEETSAQMKLTDEKMKETSAQMKLTDEQMKRTDEKLERIGITLGNVTHNQGDVAEEFFLNSLLKDNRLGNIYFDDVVKNMEKHRDQMQNFKKLFPIYQNYKQYGAIATFHIVNQP